MPTSQYKIYSSSDPYGPGLISGLSGSLLIVLNACLVNGYGTGSFYKSPAGWTKPVADSGSVYGCFKQGSGSQFVLFINDASPVVANEAWATGYTFISSVSPTGSSNSNFGIGNGEFPLASQGFGGLQRVTWRKSITSSSVGRSWIVAADASTMYLWISTTDIAVTYYHVAFGDFYSLETGGDSGSCMIYGRYVENDGAITADKDYTDCIARGPTPNIAGGTTVGFPGHYMARPASGAGGSTIMSRKGDSSVSGLGVATTAVTTCNISGILACPNPTDNSIRVAPLWVMDPGTPSLRGRYRGLYQPCHAASNFVDGQTFVGSGVYSGRTFMIIKLGSHAGYWALETSNTVETN